VLSLCQAGAALAHRGLCAVGEVCRAHLLSSTVFIYSMPGYKCSIKERMLYSSCKSRLLDSVEQDFQLEISKKVPAGPQGPHLTLRMGHWES
jgi:hypothetical protein